MQRKPELTHEEFVNHWFKIHGALARKVPGVRRYMQNHIREISSRADIPDLDMEIDGIAVCSLSPIRMTVPLPN